MYYSNGNYEAFPRPRKPKGVENKTACFVGSGLAALSNKTKVSETMVSGTVSCEFCRNGFCHLLLSLNFVETGPATNGTVVVLRARNVTYWRTVDFCKLPFVRVGID